MSQQQNPNLLRGSYLSKQLGMPVVGINLGSANPPNQSAAGIMTSTSNTNVTSSQSSGMFNQPPFFGSGPQQQSQIHQSQGQPQANLQTTSSAFVQSGVSTLQQLQSATNTTLQKQHQQPTSAVGAATGALTPGQMQRPSSLISTTTPAATATAPPSSVQTTPGQTPPPPQPTTTTVAAANQPPQQQKDINTASLCKIGQETVQEIVSRTQEVFQTLKIIQPPNGIPQVSAASAEKKAKVQEHLKNIKMFFKRLHLIYDRCNENCQEMEYMHVESFIPFKDEAENTKLEERKSMEVYRSANEEYRELMEQVVLKNRHLKEIIDHLRNIIWEINTMLAMRLT